MEICTTILFATRASENVGQALSWYVRCEVVNRTSRECALTDVHGYRSASCAVTWLLMASNTQTRQLHMHADLRSTFPPVQFPN